ETPTSQGDLTGQLLVRLGYAYFMHNAPKALWATLAGMNHAERFPPSLPLAFGYAGYGAVFAGFRRFTRGLYYIDRSIKLRREYDDLWGIAQSLYAHGILLYTRARFEESIAKLDESLELYRRAGDQWEINANRLHWALCQTQLGNLSASIETGRLKFAEGVRL